MVNNILSHKINKTISLIFTLLPADVSKQDIMNNLSQAISNDEMDSVVLKKVLESHPRLNWDAYLENYQDVKKAGVNPVEHFINEGIYENRKLFSWHPLRNPIRNALSPKVTVIVTNYNHEIFLDKCLDSLAGQTISDIEIIVVDDASEDDSKTIIERYTSTDPRFKSILLSQNMGTHYARKIAVKQALGDYLMFLDSDDFFAPTTCEKAWKAVAKGYDMGQIGLTVINHGKLDPDECKWLEDSINRLKAGVYNRSQMLQNLFIDGGVRANLSSKIVLREIAQAGFAETDDGYYVDWEDGYELYTIVSKTRNLVKIKDMLYMFSFGSGMSYNTDAKYKFLTSVDQNHIYEKIQSYICNSSLKPYSSHIKQKFIDLYFSILPKVEKGNLGEYFTAFASRFGALSATIELAKRYFDKYNYIASKFATDKIAPLNRPRKTISIVYEDIMSKGGIQTTIQSMCKLLVGRGYQVNLFLQKRTEYDISIDPHVHIFTLGLPEYSSDGLERHIHSFYKAIQPTHTDVVIYLTPINHWTIWDIILLKFMGIPILHSLRRDHNIDIIMRGKKSLHRDMLNVLRFIDKVFTLSISTEIYLRLQGIDAEYIPNPIRKFEKLLPDKKDQNNILVIARLCDPIKKAKDCLRIIAEVKKSVADAKMIFVGFFENQNEKNTFYDLAQSLNVTRDIHVTGWVLDPDFYIDQCKVMLSTAYIEGFPNGIAESQSRGLPVVMYWLDIMMSQENESIISVPQDDYRAAAQTLVELLCNDAERERLGAIAMAKAARYSPERFGNSMINMVENFDKYSPVRYYTPGEYNLAIRSMTLYAGNGVPE